MRQVRTHRFNGIQYDIDLCGSLKGCCDQPKGGNPSLRIMIDLKTQDGLITTIHEAMHASSYDKYEATVDRSSKEIGCFLWRLGYRRKGE